MHESNICTSPPPTCIGHTVAILLHCIGHTVAILLHDYWAVKHASSTPRVYAIQHTRSVITISCCPWVPLCVSQFAVVSEGWGWVRFSSTIDRKADWVWRKKRATNVIPSDPNPTGPRNDLQSVLPLKNGICSIFSNETHRPRWRCPQDQEARRRRSRCRL